jgi:hypothetical protein
MDLSVSIIKSKFDFGWAVNVRVQMLQILKTNTRSFLKI